MTRSWKLACSSLIFCCYDGVIMVTIKAKKHGALHKQHWTRYEERKEENRGRISVPINAKLTNGDWLQEVKFVWVLHTVEIQILFFSGFFFCLRLKKDHAIHQDQGFGIW